MALFIEITAADGLVSRTRLEPGNNRFTVRLGDTYRIFDDQTGVTPETIAVKRVDNNLVVDGLDTAQGNVPPTTVELPEFYSVCSAGSPCALTVDSGPQSAPVTVTPGTQPIGALSDGAFVLYDRDFAETAPAEPSLADNTSLKYAVYGLGGAAVLGLALGGGGGGGDGGGGGGSDSTLKLTSSTFVNSRTPVITGEGEPGARITVRIDTDGDNVPNVTYAATVGADFKWAINLASAVPESGALPAGGLPDASSVSITSTTDQGNTSLPVFVLAYDGVAPAPAILAVVASDNVVNAAEKASGVAVAGEAEPGATVTVTWSTQAGDTQVRTAVADANGGFQTPGFDSASIPSDGPSTITAIVQDRAGNNSDPSQVNVTVNTAPARLELTSGSDGINASDAVTGITLGGSTDPGGTVSVTWNGAAKAPVVADGAGNWQVAIAPTEIPQVPEGSVPYQIAATNLIGNTNAIGGQVAIDAVAPPAPVIATVGGDNVVNAAEETAGVVVTGTAERNTDIDVTWGSLTASARADQAGNWSASFGPGNAPPDQTYTVTAVARDAAGNTSTGGSLAGVLVDTTPPAVTLGNVGGADGLVNIAEAAGGIRLSGTNEAGAVLSVSWNQGAAVAPTMTSATTWEALFPSPGSTAPLGNLFEARVTATDGVGNVTTVARNIGVDLSPPADAVAVAVDVDNQVNSLQSYSVTGFAEIGSQVAVTIGATTVTATTAADGTWTASGFLAPLVVTPTVASANVQVTDAVGNPGAVTSTPFNIVPFLAGNAPPAEPGVASLTAESLLGGGDPGTGAITATSGVTSTAAWSAAEVTAALLPIEEPRA